jgi:hypothetical protein
MVNPDTKWRAWTDEDENRPRNTRTGPHAWRRVKGFRFPWPYCAHCGLVWLKNTVSNKLARKPCVYEEAI